MSSSAPPSPDAKYRPDIDGLRAVAVLSVLLFHVGFDAFPGGYVGVDVFFVISGFLITRLIRNEIKSGRFTFGNFYSRRARRLFPALLFTWVLCGVLAFLLFSPAHLERFGGALLYSVLSVSNFFFWTESGYFDLDVIVKPLIHTWSLSVEEQFYFVWPAIFFGLLKFRRTWAVPAFLTIAGLISLYYAEAWIESDPAGAFFLAPFRVMEFAIGAIMVWLADWRARNNAMLEASLLVGLTTIAYAVLEFDENTPFPGLAALAPCAGTALVIYGGTARYCARLITNKPAVWIGLISYSLYLLHWPLIVFYRYYTFDVFSTIEKLTIIALSIAGATGMYVFIEQPFRSRRSRGERWSPAAFGLGCTALALLTVFAAANMWAGDGWPWRLGERAATAESLRPVRGIVTPFLRELGEAVADGGSRAYRVGSGADDAGKKVLVLGDSHAEHLTFGLDYLGKKYGFSADFYVSTGCPPIFGTYKIFGVGGIKNPPPRQELCKRQTGKWEQFVAEQGYDYVILASRWAWLYESTQYEKYRIRNDFLVEPNDPVYTVDGSRKTFTKRLPLTIESISRSGAVPIVFSQVPNVGKNPSGCDDVPRYVINDRAMNKRCSGVSAAAALERLRFTDATIRETTTRLGARGVIPSEYFCDPEAIECRGFDGATRLYKDADHINEAGSLFLAKHWEAEPGFPFATEAP